MQSRNRVGPIASPGDEKAAAHKKMVDDLNANKNPKTKGYVDELGVEKEKLNVKREDLHKDMYRRQRDLLSFPGDLNDKYKDKEFGAESRMSIPDPCAGLVNVAWFERVIPFCKRDVIMLWPTGPGVGRGAVRAIWISAGLTSLIGLGDGDPPGR